MKIDILKLIIATESKLKKSYAEKIRGYFGNLFLDNPSAHGHLGNDRLNYHYPCIQYKVVKGMCLLIGFKDGLEIIKNSFYSLQTIIIEDSRLEIESMKLESYSSIFSIKSEQIFYTFFTPWLALNEVNYERYQKLGEWEKRKEMLEKILIGNILSMSKSLSYTVPEPIIPHIEKLKEVQTSLKGNPMIGFLGKFSVNFEIPDYWGIGKSVSRGFGTIKKVKSAEYGVRSTE